MHHIGRTIGTALLVGILAWSSAAVGEPFAWSINSRGFLPDDEQNNALWRVNLATGQAEYIGWTAFLDVEGIALDSDGILYGASDDENTLIRVSLQSGLGAPVAGEVSNMDIPITQVMDFGMTWTCAGELLVSSDFRESLYLADPGTGNLQLIGAEASLGAPITDIAAWGDELYGIGQGLNSDGGTDSPNLYRIDRSNATATLIGGLGSAIGPYANAGLAFDADGVLWAITDRRSGNNPDIPSEIFRINLETGQATKIADADVVGFESLAIAPPGGCNGGGPGPTPPPPPPNPGPGSNVVQLPAIGPVGLAALLGLVLVIAGWSLSTSRRTRR